MPKELLSGNCLHKEVALRIFNKENVSEAPIINRIPSNSGKNPS